MYFKLQPPLAARWASLSAHHSGVSYNASKIGIGEKEREVFNDLFYVKVMVSPIA